MFSRKRSASQPPVHHAAIQTAANAAAAQAFLSARRSDANLSATAAAAALRAHATTPVPIESIQTKRMIRRDSNASYSSALGAVQRRGSLSSMTGRSFRSPTPDGASMSTRTFRSPTPDSSPRYRRAITPAPPIPPLPTPDSSPRTREAAPAARSLPVDVPPVPVKSHKRSSSLEPPVRVSSPTPKKGQRPMSMDRGAQVSGARAIAARATGLPQVQELPLLERDTSQTSPNYSRPMSPTGTRTGTSAKAVRNGTAAPAAAVAAAINTQQPGPNGAVQPIKKKKNVVQATEGGLPTNGLAQLPSTGPLISNGVAPQARVASVSSTSTLAPSTEGSLPATPPKRKKKVAIATDTNLNHQPVVGASNSRSMSPVQGYPSAVNSRATGLSKQPSTVRERDEQENEQVEAASAKPRKFTVKAPSSGAAISTQHSSTTASRSGFRSSSQPPTYLSYSQNAPVGTDRSGELTTNGSRKHRPQSVSPARAARFSTVPVIIDPQNFPKHSPPPRALSPAKSAMKRSPSSSLRTPSPAPGLPASYTKGAPSDSSETLPLMPEDALRPKKKTAKVSFDRDMPSTSQNTLKPGRVASAPNFLRTSSYDSDDVMQPRPALPSFGSVRPSKARDNKGINLNSTIASIAGGTPTAPLEHSSDHALGGLFAKERVLAQERMTKKDPTGGELAQQQISKGTPIESVLAQEENSKVVPTVDVPAQEQASKDVADKDVPDQLFKGTQVPGLSGAAAVQPTASPVDSSPPLNDVRLFTTARLLREGVSESEGPNVPSFAILPPTPGLDEEKMKGLMDSTHESMHEPPRLTPQHASNALPSTTPLDEAGVPENGTRELSSPNHIEEAVATRGHAIATKDEASATDVNAIATQDDAVAKEDGVVATHHDPTPTEGDAVATHYDATAVETDAHAHAHQPDSDSEEVLMKDDNSSHYSDAEQNLADDQGGFASLDAIVESRMSLTAARGNMANLGEDHPAVDTPTKGRISNWLPGQDTESPSAAKTTDWEATRAYWSSLSEKRKQQIEHEAAISPRSETSEAPIVEQRKPKKKKKAAVSQDPSTTPKAMQQPPNSRGGQQSQRAASEPVAMRQSMRGPPPTPLEGATMRRSSQPPNPKPTPSGEAYQRGHMATASLPANNAKSIAQSTNVRPASVNRPASAVRSVPPPVPSPATVRAASVGVTTVPRSKPKRSTLRRTLSNASDSSASESSFRRKRRASSANPSGVHSMRRSMREPPQSPNVMRPTSPTDVRSGRFSIRSLSPTGSFMRRPLRETMRGSADMGDKSLRNKDPTQPKSAMKFPSLGKASKEAAKPSKPTARFATRFRYSSDEDDAQPTYRSRFADSDDDEPETPVRGIPRRPGQASGNSTDLSDSEDEQKKARPAGKAKSSTQPGAHAAPEGNALAAGSLRDATNHAEVPDGFPGKKEKKKRGFFGLGKKKAEPTTAAPLPNGRPSTPPAASRPAAMRGSSTLSSQASPAARTNDAQTTAPSTPLKNPAGWPGPPPVPADTAPKPAHRPQTSDGHVLPTTMRDRPDLGTRRISEPSASKNYVVSSKTGKKKRFPMLRRVFGLYD